MKFSEYQDRYVLDNRNPPRIMPEFYDRPNPRVERQIRVLTWLGILAGAVAVYLVARWWWGL